MSGGTRGAIADGAATIVDISAVSSEGAAAISRAARGETSKGVLEDGSTDDEEDAAAVAARRAVFPLVVRRLEEPAARRGSCWIAQDGCLGRGAGTTSATALHSPGCSGAWGSGTGGGPSPASSCIEQVAAAVAAAALVSSGGGIEAAVCGGG